MVYITGPFDTLHQLRQKEGFSGSMASYEKKCAELNPEMCAKYPDYRHRLPSYTPIFLSSEEVFLSPEERLTAEDRREIWQEFCRFSNEEMRKCYNLQEGGSDVISQVVMDSIMQKFQEYTKGLKELLNEDNKKQLAKHVEGSRDLLKIPLITTPWNAVNEWLTIQSIPDILTGGFSHMSYLIKNSKIYQDLDTLYAHMISRDELNRFLHLFRDWKGIGLTKQNIEEQLRQLNIKIKELLPKKMETEVKNFLRKRFSLETLKKISLERYSVKAAQNSTFFTLNINFLTKSGLQQLRKMISNLKILTTGSEIYGNMLGRIVVLYDVAKAFITGENAARAFFVGGLGLYISTAATANLGAAAGVGTLLVEGGMALSNILMAPTFLAGSSIVLLNCPILGWAVLFVGLIGAAALSWGIGKNLESVWDTSATFSAEMYKKASDTVKQMRQDFQMALMQGEKWIYGLYGVPHY